MAKQKTVVKQFHFSAKQAVVHTEKIYVFGHPGIVGPDIVRSLEKQGQTNIVNSAHVELDRTK